MIYKKLIYFLNIKIKSESKLNIKKLLIFFCDQHKHTLSTRPETFIRDPDSIRDPIRKFGYPERPNPDLDTKMLDPSNGQSQIRIQIS